MSENKVSGAGSNSWGLSTLVEKVMGEPETQATESTTSTGAQKEVSQKSQEHTPRDSFEQDTEDGADDFMNWVGNKATAMSDDASKLIDEGTATVSDFLQRSDDLASGGRIEKKYVDAVTDTVRTTDAAEKKVSDKLGDGLERALSMGRDVLCEGLDEIGLPESKRAEIEARIDRQVEVAAKAVSDAGKGLVWEDPKNIASNAATMVLTGAAEILGDASESIKGHEDAFAFVKDVGSGMETSGKLLMLTGVPAGPVVSSLGATIEWLGNAPENVSSARETALELKSGIENFDPSAMANRIADLQDGEAVVYNLKAKASAKAGIGISGEFASELKIEKKGDKFIAEIKGEVGLGAGVGLEAMGEGASADIVSANNGVVVLECDSREAVEHLAKMIKAGTYGPDAYEDMDLPESINLKKISYTETEGAGFGADIAPFASLGFSKSSDSTIGISNDRMGDGKADVFLEKSSKKEASISFDGFAKRDKVSPREVREHLTRIEEGNIGELIAGLEPDALDILTQTVLVKPGEQLKATKETKYNVTTPLKGIEGASDFVQGVKMSYEQKISLVVGGGTVEFERKFEIKDPVGLAERLGVNVAALAEQFENGQITRESLRQKLKGDLTDYLSYEVKVQQRSTDTAGVIGMGGITATRTELSKPLELYASKLDKSGEKVRSGLLDDAIDEVLENDQESKASRKELRMSDLATHVIKG